ELAVVAALDEQPLRMRLLEERRADLSGRDVRRDREHRHTAPVSVVQSLDQMRVARAAAARADGEPAGEVRLRRRRERAGFLIPDVDPLDAFRAPDRIHEGVQAVADDAVHARDAGLTEDVHELLCDVAHESLLSRSASPRAGSSARPGTTQG